MQFSREHVIKNDRTDFNNFILTAITFFSAKEFAEILKDSDTHFDFSLTFNGHEIPINGVFEEWLKNKKFDIERRAADILMERIDSVKNHFDSTRDIIDLELANLKGNIAGEFDLTYNSYHDRLESN
jgi:hypothetical protein